MPGTAPPEGTVPEMPDPESEGVGPEVMEQGRRRTLVPHPRAEMDDGPPGLTRAVLVTSYIPRWGQRGLHCLPITVWGPLSE